MCWGATESFSGDELTPARGRRFGSEQLSAALADLPGRDDLIFDACVVVSELLTNSIRAGSRAIRLSLSLHRDLLRLTVDDDAPGTPQLRAPRDDEATGRGMAIVASLVSAWGIEPRIPGKQVWADLDVSADLTVDLPSCHRPTRFQLALPSDQVEEIRGVAPTGPEAVTGDP